MSKRGGLRSAVPVFVVLLLVALAYLSAPSRFAAGPTGLDFFVQDVIDACVSVNTSTTLTTDLFSNGSCITILGNDVDFNCDGHLIRYGALAAGATNAIIASNVRNVTIRNCVIIDLNASGTTQRGINVDANFSSIINNSVKGNATTTSDGILVGGHDNIIRGNTVFMTGSPGGGSNHGIELAGTLHNVTHNTIRTNNATANGNGIYGGSGTAQHLIAYNTVVLNSTSGSINGIFFEGITAAPARANSIKISNNNVTIVNTGASQVGIRTNLAQFINITENFVNMSGNGSSQFGIELQLTNFSLTAYNTIFANGTSAAVGIRIRASIGRSVFHQVIGNNITTGSSLFGGNSGIALATNEINATISGNNISASGFTCGDVGISLTASPNAVITNNDIRTSGPCGTNNGIDGCSNNCTIANNIVRTNGSAGGSNLGIRVGGDESNITGNTVFADGNGISNYAFTRAGGGLRLRIEHNTFISYGNGTDQCGIVLASNPREHIVNNNTAIANGTSVNCGMRLSGGGNNTFANNTFIADGSAETNYGIRFVNGASGNFTNSRIVGLGAGANYGILFDTLVSGLIFNRTNLTTRGNLSHAIAIRGSSGNLFDNTFFDNPAEWLNSSNSTDQNNFTNTTFFQPDGSIRFPGTFAVTGTHELSKSKLNVSPNKAFVNSSNLSMLNTSAQITLFNVLTNALVIDQEDDGTSVACPASICALVSFDGSTLVFNVTQFTTYSAGGVTVVLTKTDTPDPVSAGSTLNYTIGVNVTQGNASNITLTDIYPNATIFVSATPTPVTGTNNTFVIGNLTENQSFSVNITMTVLNAVVNGTVINNSVNATYQNQTGAVLNATVTASTTVQNSNVLLNSTVTATNASGSVFDSSTVSNSTVNGSTINQSTVTGSTIANSTITNSTVTNSTSTNSSIINSTVTNSVVTNSTITNSTISNLTVTNAVITNGECTAGSVVFGGITTACPANLSTVYAGGGGGGGGGAGGGSGGGSSGSYQGLPSSVSAPMVTAQPATQQQSENTAAPEEEQPLVTEGNATPLLSEQAPKLLNQITFAPEPVFVTADTAPRLAARARTVIIGLVLLVFVGLVVLWALEHSPARRKK